MGNFSIRAEGCIRASCKIAGKKLTDVAEGWILFRYSLKRHQY